MGALRFVSCCVMLMASCVCVPAIGQCPAPGKPAINLFSNLPTAKDQSYVLAWTAPAGLQSGSTYLLERTADATFQTGVESFTSTSTAASLKSKVAGNFLHRVRAVQTCGTQGEPSDPVTIRIVDGSPVVIFSSQPPAVVRTVGDAASSASFEVRNLGGTPFSGYLSPKGAPFFTFPDSIVTLGPGEAKTFSIDFYSSFVNTPGTYQGLLTIESAGTIPDYPYPWALVNLTVAPKPVASRKPAPDADEPAPVFETEFVSFQATEPGSDPPPMTISVTNTRSTDLAIAAETGPDGWLVPSPGWNALPLRPGEKRTFQVSSRRIQGQAGGVLPRYAFLTVRTQDGKSSRVQFQDLDDKSGGACDVRTALLAESSSLIVPSVVSADYQVGGRRVVFVSKLLISNIGRDAVTVDIYFTRDDGSGTSGFDCTKVKKATLAIPGSDALILTDPLAKLFGYGPADVVHGSFEIRSEKIAQVRADSVVDTPAPGGGFYGFQMPVMKRGTGAALNTDLWVTGLISNETYRSNLILSETSGQAATVLVSVFAPDGTLLFRTTKTIPPYAKLQAGLNDSEIFAGRVAVGAAASVTVLDGAGTVAAVATVIDRVNQDASCLVGRPQLADAASRKPVLKAGELPNRAAVPTVVTGYNSKPGRGPFPYESSVSITNPTSRAVRFQLTFVDGAGSERKTEVMTVGARRTVAYQSVLKEAFSVTGDAQGLLFVDAEIGALVLSSKVYSNTDDGSFGDAIPVYPLNSAALTTALNKRQLLSDGFEHSTNEFRGARTNLILTEIAGKASEVEVKLFEKGKERQGPIGKGTFQLKAYEKLQLNRVVSALGAGGKDRTNILCDVTATAASQGAVVALGTRVDNLTADTKVLVLLPLNESQGSSVIGF